MNGSAARYWLILAVLLAAMYGAFSVWRVQQHEASKGASTTQHTSDSGAAKPGPLEEFVLTDQFDKPFDSKSLRGKVWVGSFFFTNCPAICWRMNQALAAMQQANPDSDVHYVSITCDPENDNSAALAKYAEHFKADPGRWKFLTGDFKMIRRIGNDFFQVAVDKGTHSDRAFVVDRDGRVRGRFRVTEPDQLELLKSLLDSLEAAPSAGDATGAQESESSKPNQPTAASGSATTEPQEAKP
jgi:cytochrome oxidase Cu insertion factor (SCO1/SenC/PrrC family)